MTIYQRIKYLREKEGMSQQELAEKVGFKTASAINKIELGLRDINQTKVIAFANALSTTPSYLMGWVDENGNEKETPDELILTEDEKLLIKAFRAAPKENQELVLFALRNSLSEQREDT